MANCPLRGVEHIKSAIDNFYNNKQRNLISFFKYGHQNPWWAHIRRVDGSVESIHSESLKKRSQDLPELFCPTGAVWIAKTENIIIDRTFYNENYYSHILDWKAALDIDDYDDLELAKAVFTQQLKK